MIIEEREDDEVEVPYMDLDDIRRDLEVEGRLFYAAPDDYYDMDDGYLDEGWKRSGRGVRGVSEEIGDRIEL